METAVPVWAWIALGITVLVLLLVDLFGHRGEHSKSRKAAFAWSVVWILAGLAFNGIVWATMGSRAGQEYLAAYLIEKSLSVDNLFVFLIVFSTLNVPEKHQHRVLFWGIFGALVFRGLFIYLGVTALEKAHWVAYVFGAILLYAAWRAYRDDPTEEKNSGTVRWLSRHLPVTHETRDGSFITKVNGKRVVTPLLLALVAIELTDIVFAIDSVPAALSVSRDRFIVFSSNAFAILGLRALYTVLAHTLRNMRHLHYGLAGVLGFAGIKLISAEWFEISPPLSIGIIVLMIGVSVWASLRARKKPVPDDDEPKNKRTGAGPAPAI